MFSAPCESLLSTRPRQDVFDYIEMFYNPKRKHARNGMLSPVEFERQQKMTHEGV
jgi:putative transposase